MLSFKIRNYQSTEQIYKILPISIFITAVLGAVRIRGIYGSVKTNGFPTFRRWQALNPHRGGYARSLASHQEYQTQTRMTTSHYRTGRLCIRLEDEHNPSPFTHPTLSEGWNITPSLLQSILNMVSEWEGFYKSYCDFWHRC